jgi:hypothetical protein
MFSTFSKGRKIVDCETRQHVWPLFPPKSLRLVGGNGELSDYRQDFARFYVVIHASCIGLRTAEIRLIALAAITAMIAPPGISLELINSCVHCQFAPCMFAYAKRKNKSKGSKRVQLQIKIGATPTKRACRIGPIGVRGKFVIG